MGPKVYSPNWRVRCFAVPGSDTDLALMVFFDNARFLIGGGEGTQRAFAQKKMGMRWLEAILLMSADSRTRAGLPGLIMTAADAGIPKLDVYGPPDTAHYIATTRSSMIRDKFVVNAVTSSTRQDPDIPVIMHQSHSITISAITLIPPHLRPEASVAGPSTAEPTSTATIPDIYPDLWFDRPATLPATDIEKWRHMIVRGCLGRYAETPQGQEPIRPPRDKPRPLHHFDGTMYPSWPEQRFPLPLPTLAEQAADMVYIFQAPEVRGKFVASKAAQLKVPVGPVRGLLTKGQTVRFEDASVEGGWRTVTAAECMSGGEPGKALIVVSCSMANVPTLVGSKAFHLYQPAREGALEETMEASLVVHRVTQEVWCDPRYDAWVKAFGDKTEHVIADPDRPTDSAYFRSSAWNAAQLASIDPDIFHLQQSDPSPVPSPDLPANTTFLTPYHEKRMHPSSPIIKLEPHNVKDMALPNDANEAIATAALRVQDPSALAEATRLGREKNDQHQASLANDLYSGPGVDIRISTLGTGSAIPSKYRNVSCTMLECPVSLADGKEGGKMRIMLDAGEGTLGQMRRLFGTKGMKGVYDELKMVFISHMHADHHLGLQSILEDRFRHGITSKLYILAPPQIALFMQESASWQSIASDEALENVVFINSARLVRDRIARRDVEDASEDGMSEAEAEEEKGGKGEGVKGRKVVREVHAGGELEGTKMGTVEAGVSDAADTAAEETAGSAQLAEPMAAAVTTHSTATVITNAMAEEAAKGEDTKPVSQPPSRLRGLMPIAAPAEWGKEDRASGARRWPDQDVLGWSNAINSRQAELIQDMLQDLDLTYIQCVQVPHRGFATALVLRHSSDWKFVYSGDTKPSERLVRAGRGATVLIHEATIEDDKPETADIKGHSTFGQAIDVGRRMGARHVLLNHFSQRYPKLPNLKPAGTVGSQVIEEEEEIVNKGVDGARLSVTGSNGDAVRQEDVGNGAEPANGVNGASTANVALMNGEVEAVKSTFVRDEQAARSEESKADIATITKATQLVDDAAIETEIQGDQQPADADSGTQLDSRPAVEAPKASIAPRLEPVVAISFDFMSVRVKDMYRVSNYLEAIEELYKEPEEDVEEGAVDGESVKAKTAVGTKDAVGESKKGKKGGGGERKVTKAERMAARDHGNGEGKVNGMGKSENGTSGPSGTGKRPSEELLVPAEQVEPEAKKVKKDVRVELEEVNMGKDL